MPEVKSRHPISYMSKFTEHYLNNFGGKVAELIPSTATTAEERANEILRPSGPTTLLSDIIAPYSSVRAGRGTEVARSLGDTPPLTIAYPATASTLSSLGGAAIGGGLGAALGASAPAPSPLLGGLIGAGGGALIGSIANIIHRHSVLNRVRQNLINRIQTQGANSITPYKPNFGDEVTDYLLPVAGPARQGQAQAYQALLNNSKLPNSGMNSSGLNATQAISNSAVNSVATPLNLIAPGSGVALGALSSLANTGVNIGRNVAARNMVESKTASEKLIGGLADGKPDSDFDKKELSMGMKDELHAHTKNKQIAKEIVKDHLVEDPKYYEHQQQSEKLASCYFNNLTKLAKSVVMHKEDKSPSGGLTQHGRDKYNRATGSHLKAPVTHKNPKGKAKARRKSFCARMSGVKGPMKDEKGRPTRKALALRKWHCR